jgi:hypothetical protein
MRGPAAGCTGSYRLQAAEIPANRRRASTLWVMGSSSKDAERRERQREYDTRMDAAANAVAAFALLVRGRETRAATGSAPLEVVFAAAGGEAALPAGVWVALRRGDVDAAIEALTAVSSERFVLGEREELGDGYRLRTVEEVRMLPDVVAILGEWGPDDPRTAGEIEELLDSRFGPVRSPAPAAAPTPVEERTELAMSVAELADVLQLSAAQGRVLTTLVRHAVLTVTDQD